MSNKRDFYEILGVQKSATDVEIKSAYRKIALKYHPDRNKDNPEAETKFKEAAEAYAVLSDPNKRKTYDQFGHAGLGGAAGMGEGPGFASMEDILSAFGDIFSGFGGGGGFESMFGGGGGTRPRRGASLRVDLQIDLEDVLKGTQKTIEIARLDQCGTCGGSGAKPGTKAEPCNTCGGHGEISLNQGFFHVRQACPSCRGTGKTIPHPCATCRGAGKVRKRDPITLTIPPGIEEGHVERLPGKGETGENGGPPGDLVVVVHIKEHEIFHRRGSDLLIDLRIRYSQAALGGSAEVPTLEEDKTARVKIPKGTQPGEILRLRGQGLPRPDGRGKGNLLVRISILVPKKLTAKQEELLHELDKIEEKQGKKEQHKGLFSKIRDIF